MDGIVSFYQILEWIMMMIDVGDYQLSDKYTHDPNAQTEQALISIPLNAETKTSHTKYIFTTKKEYWFNVISCYRYCK